MHENIEFQVSEEGQAAVMAAFNHLHEVCEKHGAQFFAAVCTGATKNDDVMEFDMGSARCFQAKKAPHSLYVMLATYENQFDAAMGGLLQMQQCNSRNTMQSTEI